MSANVNDLLGSALTFLAYLKIYIIVIKVPRTKAIILKLSPFVKLIPAALEPITTENGFTVENILPIEEPMYIAAIHTITS